jgi:hypothetical protein
MLRHIPEKQPQESLAHIQREAARPDRSLQVILWTLWTLAVVGAAYHSWHADMVAHRPTELLGLVIHCTVVGIIGLIVLTLIERHLEPWRFLD